MKENYFTMELSYWSYISREVYVWVDLKNEDLSKRCQILPNSGQVVEVGGTLV